MRTQEEARKLGILRAQLKYKLICDGLIAEDTQLILDDDKHFSFEYTTTIWYSGTIEYIIAWYTTELNETLMGYQLVDYHIHQSFLQGET